MRTWQPAPLRPGDVLVGAWAALAVLVAVAGVALIVAFHHTADPGRHCELVHHGVYDHQNRSCQLPDGSTLYGL